MSTVQNLPSTGSCSTCSVAAGYPWTSLFRQWPQLAAPRQDTVGLSRTPDHVWPRRMTNGGAHDPCTPWAPHNIPGEPAKFPTPSMTGLRIFLLGTKDSAEPSPLFSPSYHQPNLSPPAPIELPPSSLFLSAIGTGPLFLIPPNLHRQDDAHTLLPSCKSPASSLSYKPQGAGRCTKH